MKTCSKCKVVKPLDCYHRDKRSKDGIKAICKECGIKYSAAYRKSLDRGERRANRKNLKSSLAARGLKTCSHCKEVKSVEDFDKSRDKGDGRTNNCKSCCSVKAREYRARLTQEEKTRRMIIGHRRHRYGLEPEDFDQIKLNQQNKCVICCEVFDGPPHVDHCHKTGKVRGLLCRFCNQGLGQFKDSPERLLAAVAYIQKTS